MIHFACERDFYVLRIHKKRNRVLRDGRFFNFINLSQVETLSVETEGAWTPNLHQKIAKFALVHLA